MAKQHRAPRADKVDKFVAVGVVDIRALAALHDQRITTDGTKSAHGTVHSADEDLLSPAEDFRGTRSLFGWGRPGCAHKAFVAIRVSAIWRHLLRDK